MKPRLPFWMAAGTVVAMVGFAELPAQYAAPTAPPMTKDEADAAAKRDDEAAAKAKAAYEADLAKLDAVPGWRGVAFGADFAPLKAGFEVEQDRGPLVIYRKKGEAPVVGPVRLETILYYVFEGKFYGVALHSNDGQDSANLHALLRAAFGPGEPEAHDGPGTIWLGRKVGVVFDQNPATGDANAFLFDHKLHDAYLKSESAALDQAAKALLKGE